MTALLASETISRGTTKNSRVSLRESYSVPHRRPYDFLSLKSRAVPPGRLPMCNIKKQTTPRFRRIIANADAERKKARPVAQC
jgi:hypothetical protein